MRIIITGTTGFIGRHLVAHLSPAHDIVALDRAAFGGDDTALHALCGRADAVIHLAGRAHKKTVAADGDLFHAENVALTQRVLHLAATCGAARFIFLSSIGVLGQRTHGRPLTESSQPAPANAYARSKAAAERDVTAFCDSHDMAWTILRPPLVYGRDAPGNIGLLQRLIRLGLPLPFGMVRNRRTVIGVDNLVALIGFCLTATAAENQVYHVGDGIDRSTADILHLLAAQENRAVRLWPMPVMLLRGAAFVTGQSSRLAPLWEDLQIDTTKLHRQLGWQNSR